MIIQQYKKSPLAFAPDEISKCINKYTPHTSFVDAKVHREANLIHFHNRWENTTQKQIITFHSEPERVNRSYNHFKSVVAQYHATLPEYAGFHPIRNIIDFYQPSYEMVKPKKHRIGFSPSVKTKINEWYNKGYEETKQIMEEVASLLDVEIDVIHGVSLQEALERKSRCSIVIDECVTKSYHRSALEGLALGKMTICSIGEDVQEIVKKTSGEHLPVENVDIKYLRSFLLEILEKYSVQDLHEIGIERRLWMEEFWNPKDVIQDYLKMYRSV